MDPTAVDQTSPADENAVSVLEEFAEAGWSVNHLIRPGGAIECGRCGATSPVDRWSIGAQHRIEGASDPDALQLVVGAACPQCEAQGVIVLGYGPTASDDDGDVLLGLHLDDAHDPIASTS